MIAPVSHRLFHVSSRIHVPVLSEHLHMEPPTGSGQSHVNGSITMSNTGRSAQNHLSIVIGDREFKGIKLIASEVELYLNLFDQLFTGISIAEMDVEFADDSNSLHYIRKFTEKKFTIGVLNFKVSSAIQLEHSLGLMEAFPAAKYSMKLYYEPVPVKLLTIPRMEYLEIMPKAAVTSFIPTAIFLKAITTQEDLYFGVDCVALTAAEWKESMQVLSAAGGTRMVQFPLSCATVVNCLTDFGISSKSQDGERIGEFEVLSCEGPSSDGTAHFRLGKCFTRIQGLSWTGGEGLCSVTLETNEEWQ